jgi:hypothetical protein
MTLAVMPVIGGSDDQRVQMTVEWCVSPDYVGGCPNTGSVCGGSGVLTPASGGSREGGRKRRAHPGKRGFA